MKVFVSWSGERSQQLALALRDWLPMVLHFVEPWVSKSDIEAGERWANEVANELDKTSFGIICVTRENINSPWILFEAGALAKSMQSGRVVPLLLDVEFKDISGPLSQFQAKKVDNLGLKEVVESINSCSETKLLEVRLMAQFEALWPALRAKVEQIPVAPSLPKTHRPQTEILEELVSSVRGIDQRFRESSEETSRPVARRKRLNPLMIEEITKRLEVSSRDPLKIIILAAYLRDDMPWLYEIVAEIFRSSASRENRRVSIGQLARLHEMVMFIRRGSIADMLPDKESYYVFRELTRAVELMMVTYNERSMNSGGGVLNQKNNPVDDQGSSR